MDTPAVAAFRAASLFFVQAVAAVPPDRYEQPWSDEWRILDLIGHGNRANLLPIEYYERPVQAAGPEISRSTCFRRTSPSAAARPPRCSETIRSTRCDPRRSAARP